MAGGKRKRRQGRRGTNVFVHHNHGCAKPLRQSSTAVRHTFYTKRDDVLLFQCGGRLCERVKHIFLDDLLDTSHRHHHTARLEHLRKRTHLAQPSCPTRHFDIHCLMAHALFVAHRGRTDVVQRLFCQGANVAFSRLHNEQHTGQLPKHVYEQKARVEMRKQNLLSSQRPLSYMSAPFCRCHSRRRHLSPLS